MTSPILNLPEKDYRAHKAISQSVLKSFGESATPLHFKATPEKQATPDMEFGSAAHCAILEPHLYHQKVVTRPAEYPDDKGNLKPWNGNSTWCITWLNNAKAKGLIVLSRDQASKIPKIVERLNKIELVREALKHGQKEVSWFAQDDETGLELKCRTDLVAMDSKQAQWLLDLKKSRVGFANAKDFGEEVQNRGYDIQAASYLAISGASKFIFVVFDDDAPFDASLIELTDRELELGYRKWRKLLTDYAQCVKSGDWPGYPQGIQKSQPPKWIDRIE